MSGSTCYFLRYSDFIDSRLDENYNNPRYDKIKILLKKSKFEIKEFGDKEIMVSITSGKTPKNIHYTDDGIPFIGAASLYQEGIDIETAPKIPREIHNTFLKVSRIKKGDLLVSIAGTIGRCSVYHKTIECNCNQAVAVIKSNADIINSEFLMKYLNSKLGQLIFSKLQHVSSQPNINTTEISKIQIILPKKELQDNIIKKLKPYKDKIEKIDNDMKSIKNNIDDIIPRLLDIENKKINYFFSSGRENTTSFFIPFDEVKDRLHFSFYHPKIKIKKKFMNSFSTTKIKDIVTIPVKRGQQPTYSQEGVIVIKTVDLRNGKINYNLKVSEDFFNRYPNAHIIKNDILVASTGTGSIGKVDVYDRDEPAMVDGHISIIRLKEGFNPYFIAYFLRSTLGRIQFDRLWTGSSGQIEIQPNDLEDFVVPDNSSEGIPTEIQKEITDKINEYNIELKKMEKECNENYKEMNDFFLETLIK